MRIRLLSLLLLLLPSLAPAADIAAENRVVTKTTPQGVGLCWYACADTIGRHCHLGTAGVQERLLTTGVHRDGLAPLTEAGRTYWSRESRVRVEQIHERNAEWLGRKVLTEDRPVIVSFKPVVDDQGRVWREEHAVIVTKIEGDVVSYVNTSNGARELTCDWSMFWSNWTGFAWAFYPLDNPVSAGD